MDSTHDRASSPSTFQSQWTPDTNPTTLPFPRDNPPFNLTAIDWHQLSLSDSEFTPHTWEDLTHLISTNQLEKLLRVPSSLKAYLAWSAHVKKEYGSATNYLLDQRLGWTPLSKEGVLRFPLANPTPFADPRDFKILRNDWPYGLDAGIYHIVVWLKKPLPVDQRGALTEEGRQMVERFVGKVFREKVGEEREGEKVLWFKNSRDLQSVRGLEHVHVLVRGVGKGELGEWLV
ncbi:hypothetical protein GQ43DRAFT_470664 [Delitschia confertaspora ATCC 74209]|uniref:N-acetylglucosamine-induced protein 1 n=1 Tax=Delitschia confertaspora ATCC 74209 TaxID=1513339 RepID=A0A9P4JNJ6_9PLEO|nr:hypothetical protein GQ43DRAFT_470664 [Delitschia confertaspora ATCC 74209]